MKRRIHHHGEVFIYIILLLLPTYLVRFTLFGIPLNLLDVLIVCGFGLLLIQVHGKIHLHGWKYPMAAFAILGAVAALVSNDILNALGIYKSFIIEPMLVAAMILTVRPPLHRVLYALSGTVVFIAAVGAIQFVTGYGIPAPWNIRGDEFRITSVYGYPNAIGLFFAPIIAMLIAWVLHVKHHRKHFTYFLIIGFLMLVLARTDGAIVAVCAGALFSILYTRWKWTAAIGVSSLLLIALIWTPTRDVLLFQDASGEVRRALWQGTVTLLEDRPVVGAGLGGFPSLYSEYKLDRHVELLLYPHNIILDFWVELGLAGLLWLITMVFAFFRRLRPLATPQRIVLMAGMVAFLVYGLVDVPYFKNDLAILFWTMLAMSTVLSKKH